MKLAVGKNFCGLDAGVTLVLPEHPGIDLGADFRIDHVDGDRDVVDIETCDRVDMIGQRQSVGRKAKFDVGRGFRNQLESLEGLLRIGERIAGARDTKHRHLRNCRGDGQDLLGGLLRRKLFADHART